MCVPGKRQQLSPYRFPHRPKPINNGSTALPSYPFLINNVLKTSSPEVQPSFSTSTPSAEIREIARNIFDNVPNKVAAKKEAETAASPSLVDETASSEVEPLTMSQLLEIEDEIPVHERKKRKRKPQKPGKTAKMKDRQFVQHHYHDHTNDLPSEADETSSNDDNDHKKKDVLPFPLKLHKMLESVEADGFDSVVSWQPHGRSFVIHKPKAFANVVMPRYFRQTKFTSFQRQLNLYGFIRISHGRDRGGYYNELFLRQREFLCKNMARIKVKGTGYKAASSPEGEPNFYAMAPVEPLKVNRVDKHLNEMKVDPAPVDPVPSSFIERFPASKTPSQQGSLFVNPPDYHNMRVLSSPPVLNHISYANFNSPATIPTLPNLSAAPSCVSSYSGIDSDTTDEADEFLEDIVTLFSGVSEDDLVTDDVDFGFLLENIIE